MLKRVSKDEDVVALPTDLRVRIISSASPGYDAMEVEQTPRSVAPDRQSVESLVSTLEDVHKQVERMTHAFSASPESRSRRPLGLLLVGSAAVCALVFAFARLALMSQPPSSRDSQVVTEPMPQRHEVPTDTWGPLTEMSLLSSTDGGLPVLSRPLPSKPYHGQKRPPCKPRVEVEINGGCWVPHMLKAPCPEDLFEYKGQCYTVSMQPPPTPQSLGQ
ncbi:hypothetical protein [Archangium lansingense]|uniref:Uncharacterized protein n=1 Tax=Archangium lansingense TaxID=2995310 RepID=A0ABT4AAR3_9BACT|nr:hypothetical protein [Archangium lansinium]MCY1078763.1 hypothetical protein [Archangium lansinium]